MNGILKITGDIIYRNLQIWPKDSIKQIKYIEINFLEYESLWIIIVQSLSDININNTQGECPRRPVYMHYSWFGLLGWRAIHKNNLIENKDSIDPYAWQLQFKITHIQVATNRYLNKIGLNDLCVCVSRMLFRQLSIYPLIATPHLIFEVDFRFQKGLTNKVR